MTNNLPPDVTLGDIDKHFGEPERYPVELTAAVTVVTTEKVDPEKVINVKYSGSESEIVHTELVDESEGEYVYVVHIGLFFESQYIDKTDIRKQASSDLTVTSASDIVREVIVEEYEFHQYGM